MAIDYDILKECGTTNERIREFFTAKIPSSRQAAKMKPEKLAAIQKDVDDRKKFEARISDWLQEHVVFSLQNHKLYSAADLAWDSVPINKALYPLIQYAQGRMDVAKCAKALETCPDGKRYIQADKNGKPTGIDLPKFTEMNINLTRSVLTRRTAAQAIKYDLYPHFKYEPRDMTQVGRLRGDLTSQRMDIMADAFGYKHQDEQICRNMLLYPNGCVAFPRASWEREVQWVKSSIDPALMYEQTVDKESGKTVKQIKKKTQVTKEGVGWAVPHGSRVFADNEYPLSSLNTDIGDTGCEYVGFWDVSKWGNIKNNPDYYNKDRISFSTNTANWFLNYANYFDDYFDKVSPPRLEPIVSDPSAKNDAKNNIGLYTGQDNNVSTFFTQLWVKVRPNQWRWGTYPYPVWVHLKVAGDGTVVYNDIMPSGVAAVFQFNCHDGRLNNISLAHELMQFQDQLSNLYSTLLEVIIADLFSVAVLNTDVFPENEEGQKIRAEFEKAMSGPSKYPGMQILEVSFEKLAQLFGGKEITSDMVFKVVRSTPNTQITAIFEAITKVVEMAERIFVMSAHEQGQAAPHEITASESNQIASSTDTMYSFISRGLDKGRAAMKRICYESTLACGSDDVELPVINRYPASVVKAAGFEVKESDEGFGDEVPYVTLMGNKESLRHDYIFTSRDGGDRQSNVQAAQVLNQLLQSIGSLVPQAQTAILSAMGKEKLLEIINTIWRLADAGVDLKLEKKPGDGDELLIEDDKQVMNIIQQLAQAVKQNTMDAQQMKQALGQIVQQVKGGPAKESISINYKDAPDDIKRQMEATAGFQPSQMTAPVQ